MPRTLTESQFELLAELLAPSGAECAEPDAAVVQELEELGYLSHGRPTPAGVEAMEPYRVKRAVFLAAGFGSRLVPITFNTPKPLVRVHGKRIIDSLLDACLAAEPMPGSQLARHLADPEFHDHHDHFTNSTPESEWRSCLEHAEKIGLGTRAYELIKM